MVEESLLFIIHILLAGLASVTIIAFALATALAIVISKQK